MAPTLGTNVSSLPPDGANLTLVELHFLGAVRWKI